MFYGTELVLLESVGVEADSAALSLSRRSALHLAMAVSVGTKPRRARSILASFRIIDSEYRCSVSRDCNALSAYIDNPKKVTMKHQG